MVTLIILAIAIYYNIKYWKLKKRIVTVTDYIGSPIPKNPILKLQNELKDYYTIENDQISIQVLKKGA